MESVSLPKQLMVVGWSAIQVLVAWRPGDMHIRMHGMLRTMT